MKSFIAYLLKAIFRIEAFKPYYFGVYKKWLSTGFFEGVIKEIYWEYGCRLRLNLNDWISQNIYFLGAYEKLEMEVVSKLLKEGDLFVDVGANIGLYSLMASRKVGKAGKVLSFEPFPENFKSLKQNIDLNGIENIQLEQLAVANSEGFLDLYYDNGEQNMGMVSENASFGQAYKIPKVSLDSFFDEETRQINFIKIDIEGGEWNALKGMSGILRNQSPKLLIEFDPEVMERTKMSDKDFIDLFSGFGYSPSYIGQGGSLHSEKSKSVVKNVLFQKTDHS